MTKTKNTKNRGFTLIELLTVVAIIGLLSAIILTSLISSRDKANNAKVKIQSKSIINALYLARDPVSGAWPGVSGQWQCLKASGTCWKGAYSGNATIVNALSPYLSSIPTPTNPPFDSGTYMNDAYLYFPDSASGFFGYSPGAYLIWAQSAPISSVDCQGSVQTASGDPSYYCYQYLGR